MDSTARIIEIFSSIQGEGIHVGEWHLFVRFWDCNMSCHYCDTDYRGPYREMLMEDLEREVGEHLRTEGPHQAVSLTGGEPLLWWRFLKGWLPSLKASGQKVYLETNGTLPHALREVLPWTDIIAMDLKPPSATKDRDVWKAHEEFLRAASSDGQRPEVFIKIVVTQDTSEEELEKSFELVAKADSRIPVVLQPVTPWGPVTEGPHPTQLTRWQGQAREKLNDVRILPQVHRLLGVP